MPVDSYYTMWGKKEATYGLDAAPTGPLNAMLVRNFKSSPMAVDALDRNLDRPVRGAQAQAITNRRRAISYELELAGSGTAGTAPPWMEFIEGCGAAAPVLTATVKAEQRMALVGAALSSITHYHWISNERRRGFGGRGDISTIDFSAGAYPFIGFDYTELLPAAAPFDAVAPVGTDYARWRAPVEVNTANTSFALGGFAAVLRSLKLSLGASIKVRNLVGANYVQRGNHAITGNIVIELPNFATKDYFTPLLGGAPQVLALTHGTVAGNILQLDSNNVQMLSVEDVSEDDIALLSIGVQLNAPLGQDDILFTSR